MRMLPQWPCDRSPTSTRPCQAPLLPPPHGAGQPGCLLASARPGPGNVHALALQLGPDLAPALYPVVLVPDRVHLDTEPLIVDRPLRRRPRAGGIVTRRRDLRFAADRLNPVLILALVGVVHDHRGGGRACGVPRQSRGLAS